VVDNEESNMSTATAAIDIAASADEVWTVVGDFGSIARWMPGIDSCHLEGGDRILEITGMSITERLVSKDDAHRTLVYAIVEGVPVNSHRATISVSPVGESSHVTWDVEAEPAEMASMLGGVYQQALDALKGFIEG
jgi:carbon monoxide dehydrogenase subunit G